MIRPRSVEELYPLNTVEGLIARKWVQMIDECDYGVADDAIRLLISRTRDAMSAAGWPATYQHSFLKQLRNDLTEITRCHPVTRQFVTVLDRELETN